MNDKKSGRPGRALHQAIHDQLREEILSGALPAGTALVQDALATRFNASRIPVREALRQLETEGLVRHQLNRGAIVAGMSVEQICELLDIRVALECFAARLAIPNLASSDIAAMERILADYDASNSVPEWAEHNRRFHLALCAPANNRKLRQLIEEFCLNTDRYTHEAMSQATGKDGPQADHYRILDACRARDAARVAALLEGHILETKKELMASARRMPMDAEQERASWTHASVMARQRAAAA